MLPGTYRVTADTHFFAWPESWPSEFADTHARIKAGTADCNWPSRLPVIIPLKSGQEVVIEHGERKTLIEGLPRIVVVQGNKKPRSIDAVTVTIRIGSKVTMSSVLVYDGGIPSVIKDIEHLRPVKKRAK